jgi:DNA-binding response OmpR family regulator
VKTIRPEVPVLIVTGFTDKIRQDEKESAGIDDVLHKPIIKAELAITVRRLLDHQAEEL